MKLLGWLLMAAMVLALLRAAAIAGVILLMLLFCISLIRWPLDTLKVCFAFILLGVIGQHPAATLLFLTTIIACGHLASKVKGG